LCVSTPATNDIMLLLYNHQSPRAGTPLLGNHNIRLTSQSAPRSTAAASSSPQGQNDRCIESQNGRLVQYKGMLGDSVTRHVGRGSTGALLSNAWSLGVYGER